MKLLTHKNFTSTNDADMTTGSLWRKIFLFSVPLMASQLLQVLFNMADVAVVGNFSSSQALGSVGSTTILVTLFTGVLIGMGSGVNVRVAQFIGAGEKKIPPKRCIRRLCYVPRRAC